MGYAKVIVNYSTILRDLLHLEDPDGVVAIVSIGPAYDGSAEIILKGPEFPECGYDESPIEIHPVIRHQSPNVLESWGLPTRTAD